jgi:alkylation response protein AidB-like acyl-CoA dehydrogenase
MGVELRIDNKEIVHLARDLARQKFAARAAHYDETSTFPFEDFDDLFSAGLHGAAAPKEYGGLGLGPYLGDVFTLWMITKELAKADLSLARCWEGHCNSLVLLEGIASESQKARWFAGVIERGEKWVAWSGEPQSRAPGETTRFGTHTEKVGGGYIVDGTKVFCTSAGGAQWAILLVNTAGPGGARHATGSHEGLLMLACDLSDTSVSFDGTWWDPIGMRATVSHLARFDKTFIPDDNLIGRPGQYIDEGGRPASFRTMQPASSAPQKAHSNMQWITSRRRKSRRPIRSARRQDVNERRDRQSLAATRRQLVGDGPERGCPDRWKPSALHH